MQRYWRNICFYSSYIIFTYESGFDNYQIKTMRKSILPGSNLCICGQNTKTLNQSLSYTGSFPSIHPFSIPAYSISRVAVGLEPIPAVVRREVGYTLDRSPVHHRARQRQTSTHTHTLTPKDNFRDTN